MSKTESKQLFKLAIYGALAAVVIDHFVQPSLKSVTKLR